ncbi:esterase-like activity of phytase family protein [Aliiroseovarius sp. PTFE2010]|uniref:esterase-like activity of phytase family protein n=1 Tax=Aliiroseovarius sp. PTFE2010 TaxID=3417190 RepID=UPI003CEFF971
MIGFLTALGITGVRIANSAIQTETKGIAIKHGPSVWIWDHPSDRFGGLSAVIVEDAGKSIVAASDRGTIFQGSIARSDGGIESIAVEREVEIRAPTEGEPETNFLTDLEGLSRMQDGGLALAYEGYARIRTREAIDAPSITLHHWAEFQDYFGNGAFESLATLPDGRLLFIVEEPKKFGSATAFVLDGSELSAPFSVPRSDGYLHTGSDLGPDECLYTLERSFRVGAGFRFRFTRYWPADGNWLNAANWNAEFLYESATARMGNAEGLSVWTNGRTITMTVVTDDGFLPFTPTRMIEFEVSPGKCRGQS